MSGHRIKPDEPAQGCANQIALTVNREEYRAKPAMEGVTTNGDECNHVDVEMSTTSKRQADGSLPLIGRDSLQSEQLFECDICGRLVHKNNFHHRIINGEMVSLCGKHYMQYITHGRFLDDSRESVIKKNTYEFTEDGVYVHTYKRNGEENSFLIDNESFRRVREKQWRSWQNNFYTGNFKPISISRFLMNMTRDDGLIVDHINGNRRDNRLANLRIVNDSQNGSNKALIQSKNKSGIAGVSWDKERKKWAVEIGYDHKHIHLSRYDLFEDACYVRYLAELIVFGEYRSNRNDEVLLPMASECLRKEELVQYVQTKLNSVGFTLQFGRTPLKEAV